MNERTSYAPNSGFQAFFTHKKEKPMKKHKPIIPLILSLAVLTACGDTSKVDSLIADSEKAATSAPDIVDESGDAAAIAESYWSDKQTSPVPDQVDLDAIDKSNGDIDVDLTILDSNIVYAQVFDMLNKPENYEGKTIKAHGTFAYTTDPATGGEYFAVFIADASACCQQGLEFVWEGDHVYPDDYPEIGQEITVIGTFSTYMEGSYQYCQLKDAQMQVW